MTNKVHSSDKYHEPIKTKYVFNEDDQVFMRRDVQESASLDKHEEVWYPINFQWIPIMALEQKLNHHSKIQTI